jgi:hypothetical protein
MSGPSTYDLTRTARPIGVITDISVGFFYGIFLQGSLPAAARRRKAILQLVLVVAFRERLQLVDPRLF